MDIDRIIFSHAVLNLQLFLQHTISILIDPLPQYEKYRDRGRDRDRDRN